MITFVSKHQPTFGDLASCFFTCMSLPSNFHLCTRYKNRNFLLNYNMQPQNNCVVIRILVCSLLLSNFSISCTMRPKPFWSGICISCFKNFVIFFSGNSVLYIFIKTKESIPTQKVKHYYVLLGSANLCCSPKELNCKKQKTSTRNANLYQTGCLGCGVLSRLASLLVLLETAITEEFAIHILLSFGLSHSVDLLFSDCKLHTEKNKN